MTVPDPNLQQMSILYTVIGLMAVVQLVSALSGIWKNSAIVKAAQNPVRNPPSEEEAARTYATKTELAAFRCEYQTACRLNHDRVDKTFSEVFGVLRAQQDSIISRLDDVKEWKSSIERQIGRLEGKLDNES